MMSVPRRLRRVCLLGAACAFVGALLGGCLDYEALSLAFDPASTADAGSDLGAGDLAEVDLSELDLTGADLVGTDLSGNSTDMAMDPCASIGGTGALLVNEGEDLLVPSGWSWNSMLGSVTVDGTRKRCGTASLKLSINALASGGSAFVQLRGGMMIAPIHAPFWVRAYVYIDAPVPGASFVSLFDYTAPAVAPYYHYDVLVGGDASGGAKLTNDYFLPSGSSDLAHVVGFPQQQWFCAEWMVAADGHSSLAVNGSAAGATTLAPGAAPPNDMYQLAIGPEVVGGASGSLAWSMNLDHVSVTLLPLGCPSAL